MFNSREPSTGVGDDPPSLNGVLPTLIVRLITIIIRSVKKPAAAAAAHSTQGSRD